MTNSDMQKLVEVVAKHPDATMADVVIAKMLAEIARRISELDK